MRRRWLGGLLVLLLVGGGAAYLLAGGGSGSAALGGPGASPASPGTGPESTAAAAGGKRESLPAVPEPIPGAGAGTAGPKPGTPAAVPAAETPAAGAAEPAAGRPVTLRGIVVDQFDRPVPEALVWADESGGGSRQDEQQPLPALLHEALGQTRSGADGRFALRIDRGEPARVRAAHPYRTGRAAQELPDPISGAGELRLVLAGEPAGAVRVEFAATQPPFHVVPVLLRDGVADSQLDPNPIASGWTAGGLTPGRWTVVLIPLGAPWLPHRRDVAVRAGETTTIVVTPAPAPPLIVQFVDDAGTPVPLVEVGLDWTLPGIDAAGRSRTSWSVGGPETWSDKPDHTRRSYMVGLAEGGLSEWGHAGPDGVARFEGVPASGADLWYRHQGKRELLEGVKPGGEPIRITLKALPPSLVVRVPASVQGKWWVNVIGTAAGNQTYEWSDAPVRRFRGLAAGEYVVWGTVFSRGFKSAFHTVTITAEAVSELTLTPGPAARLTFHATRPGYTPKSSFDRVWAQLRWKDFQLKTMTAKQPETVPAGRHLTFRIQTAGFEPVEQTLMLAPGEVRDLGTIVLTPIPPPSGK